MKYPGTSMKCVKLMMVIFSCALLLVGLVVLGVGIGVLAAFSAVTSHLGSGYNVAPIILLVGGMLVVLVSVLGCAGTIMESNRMLHLFVASVFLLLLLQLTGAICAFYYRQGIQSQLETVLLEQMKTYNHSRNFRDFITTLEVNLNCCGAKSYEDYSREDIFNDTYVPESCCKYVHCDTRYDPDSDEPKDFYTQGCMAAVIDFMKRDIAIIAGLALFVCLLQVLGITFAIFLSRNISHYEII